MLRFAFEQVNFESAACRSVDWDLFFPEKGESHLTLKAKKICAVCPIITTCRDYVLSHPDINYGVWAMMSPREYRNLRQLMGYPTEVPEVEIELEVIEEHTVEYGLVSFFLDEEAG
jgi:WhiB family transcriptional regulator, redox-sensing transcriptional regulator